MAKAARPDLVCKICNQLLENPHITPCCIQSLCLKHFKFSASSSISCPACKKQFALDDLVPDKCRKRDSEILPQKSQDFTEFHHTSTLGRNFNCEQKCHNLFSEVPLNVREQAPNFQNKSNTNRNFGGQSGKSQYDFNSDQCQIDPNLISDAELRRKNTCSNCLKEAKCAFCQHHCKLYYCPECYKKHTSDENQVANLKAIEERLNNIISDISRLLKIEALRRTDRMTLISGARQALSENFAASLQQVKDSKTELLQRTGKSRSDVNNIQECLNNKEWLMDMLNRGNTNTAKEAKEILEVHQRKVVLGIGRRLKALEKEEVPSVNVEKILMMTDILDGHSFTHRRSNSIRPQRDHRDGGPKRRDKSHEVPKVENYLKELKENLDGMNKLVLGE